jgi:hypothetical protein
LEYMEILRFPPCCTYIGWGRLTQQKVGLVVLRLRAVLWDSLEERILCRNAEFVLTWVKMCLSNGPRESGFCGGTRL